LDGEREGKMRASKETGVRMERERGIKKKKWKSGTETDGKGTGKMEELENNAREWKREAKRRKIGETGEKNGRGRSRGYSQAVVYRLKNKVRGNEGWGE
jgi:hypothetical protein